MHNLQDQSLPNLDRAVVVVEEEAGPHSVAVQPARSKCGIPLLETTLAEIVFLGCKLLKVKVRVRHVLKLRASTQAPASVDVKLFRK